MTSPRPRPARRLAAALCALAALGLAPGLAAAQDEDPTASPRLGTALGLAGESPAVWIAPDRAWVPSTTAYLSACAPGRSCAPVVSRDACAPPACPGRGVALTVAEGAAPVGDLPTDHDGYQRELEALRADPRSAPIRGSLSDHPDHADHERDARRQRESDERERRRRAEDPRWVSRYRDGDRWEAGASATVATLARGHGTWVGATASLGLGFQLRANDADEGDEEETFFNALIGDTFGLALRVHVLNRVDAQDQAGRWIGAVGLGPLVANRYERSVVRLPTVVGVAIPEVGAILRGDEDVQLYAAWSLPFSFLLTHEMALDVTARMMLVDGWGELPADAPEGESPPSELIFGLSAGLRFL